MAEKEIKVSDKEVDEFYKKLKEADEKHFYFLNSDVEHTKRLVKGILINIKRYGYGSCPCRLADGERKLDLDIICPCNYRDLDMGEYGHCYCALYVTYKNLNKKEFDPIPERRKSTVKERNMMKKQKLPVWRCEVCGYLCSRENAPDKCPICGADHDRFEKFEGFE